MRIGDKRLLELADRLLEIQVYEGIPNKRALDEFNFTVIERYNHITLKSCGCALGEGRHLFKHPLLNFVGSRKLFQITPQESLYLFDPYSQFTQSFKLDRSATAEDVAYNIIDFVEGRHL